MNKLLLTCVITFSLIGCSVKESSPSLNEKAEAAESNDVEVEEKKAPKPQKLTLTLGDGTEKEYFLRDLPLVQKYLEASTNPEAEIKQMSFEAIDNPLKDTNLYMLGYACGIDHCSRLLIKEKNNEVQTRLASDLSVFREAVFSPDQEHVLLRFHKDNEIKVLREKVKVLQIANLEPIPLISDSEVDLDFKWPIEKLKWKDKDTIDIQIPQLIDASYESLYEWFQSDQEKRPKKSITLTLED